MMRSVKVHSSILEKLIFFYVFICESNEYQLNTQKTTKLKNVITLFKKKTKI